MYLSLWLWGEVEIPWGTLETLCCPVDLVSVCFSPTRSLGTLLVPSANIWVVLTRGRNYSLGNATQRCFLGDLVSSQLLLAPTRLRHPVVSSFCFLSCRSFCRAPLSWLRQHLANSPRQTGRYSQVLCSVPRVDQGHVPGTPGKLLNLSLPAILHL